MADRGNAAPELAPAPAAGARAGADTAGRGPDRPRPRGVSRVVPLAVAVIAAAWALAITAEVTGTGDRFHHHELVGAATPIWVTLGLFLVAWQIHIAAMMLPSSLPLITLFRRASATQPHPHAARAAFIAGYLAIWTAFGAAALAGDAALHELVHHWAWLDQRPHLIAGAVLVAAGAFQFSNLKDRCLRQCRHPATFLVAHYQRGTTAAFALGRRHGLHCLGCCWALMLVMFSVGIANLAWMAPLALLMLYEKTAPNAERLIRPIGVALVTIGALILANPTWLPDLFPTHAH